MAIVFLIGSNDPLLEGIAQTLAVSGHQPRICHTIAEALEMARAEPPLAVVIERVLAVEDAAALRMPVQAGGATLLFHSGTGAAPRLVALIQRMEERAQATGRGRRGHDTPPEHRAAP
jgi:hypothetical protein